MRWHLAGDQHSIQAHICAEGEGCRGGPERRPVHGPGRVQAQLGRHAAHLQGLASARSSAGREEALLPWPHTEVVNKRDRDVMSYVPTVKLLSSFHERLRSAQRTTSPQEGLIAKVKLLGDIVR